MGRIQRRGFTFIELMIVVAILGIAGAVVVPALSAMRWRAQHTSAVRQLAASIKRLRGLASKGEPYDATQRYRYAAVEIVSASAYQIVWDLDTDSSNSNSRVVQIVQFDLGDDRAGLQFPTAMVGKRVLLDGSGVRDASDANSVGTLTLSDTRSGRDATIQVSLAGTARILW